MVGADVVVQDPGHLRVQPRHQPPGPLHHGGRQPAGPEGLGQLQPDVTAAHDDRALGVLVELGDDPVHVGDVAQHIHLWVVGAGDRRPDRFGPQAQHQLVVGLPVGSLLCEVAHLHFLGVAVDAEHVLAGPHIQRQGPAEAFRRLQQQAVPVRDGPADVVRQATVRERHIAVPLQHHDLGRLIQPPQPRPRRGPGRHPAHNHRLHLIRPVRQGHAHVVYWILRGLGLSHHPPGDEPLGVSGDRACSSEQPPSARWDGLRALGPRTARECSWLVAHALPSLYRCAGSSYAVGTACRAVAPAWSAAQPAIDR
jgi:hypothetical protein